MKSKAIVFFSICYLGIQTYAQTIPAGVFSELAKYPGLSVDYVQKLPEFIAKNLAAKEQRYAKDITSVCQSKTNVQYISSLTNSQNETVNEFESGFIHIDATFCFENTTAAKVIDLYSMPEFQQSSVSTIKESVRKGNLVCEKTIAPTIGNSHYCYNQEVISQPGYVISFSFNVWNDSVANADAPVYFREVVVSATQIQNTTQFHLQTLVRGPKLNFIQKMFAKGAIETEQKSVYEKMKLRLQ